MIKNELQLQAEQWVLSQCVARFRKLINQKPFRNTLTKEEVDAETGQTLEEKMKPKVFGMVIDPDR